MPCSPLPAEVLFPSVAQQEVQVEVKDHLRAGDFERASCYTQSRQVYRCRCDEVMCCEVAEAALRRKHDWVPRLSRLVEQQGKRVTARNEHLLPPAHRHSDSCRIKPVGLLHHVKEVLHDSRSAFVCKEQTTRP